MQKLKQIIPFGNAQLIKIKTKERQGREMTNLINSVYTKEREAQFKTDFLPQKPDIEELQMCIDGLQRHRIDLEQQLSRYKEAGK